MRTIGMLLSPGFQVIALSAFTAFEMANMASGAPLYGLRLISEGGGPINSSFGAAIATERLGEAPLDTILIAVGSQIPTTTPAVVAFLKDAVATTRRIASLCVGTYVLGEAGLLDGRRATTHWAHAEELQRRFPKCLVDGDRIYIADGQIWSSAGMSAAADLAVGMIERDHGKDFARRVARGLVMRERRLGGQPQRSSLLDLDARADRIQNALTFARSNLARPIETADLARAACLSDRHFNRLFRAETGTSPARAIETLRIEAAKTMLGESRLAIDVVAREAGFGSYERMRRAFIRAYGEPPRNIRAKAGPLALI